MKTEKHCRGCDTTKPAEEFYKIKGKYLSALCKPCDVRKATAYGAANPERRKQYRETYRRKNAGSIDYRVRHIYESMVERSRRKGWPRPEFTKDEVRAAVEGGRCAQTGVPFDFAILDGKQNPWTPVPDRIDSTGPYTKANVQWVCNMYNTAKSAWTDAEVHTMMKTAASQPGDF